MTTSTTSATIINHFIGGVETSGQGQDTKPVYNPATGEITAELRLANAADLEATVAAAKTAAHTWGDTSLAKRTAVLFRFRELVAAHVDDLAELITAEHGKVLLDAKGRSRVASTSSSSHVASRSCSKAIIQIRCPRGSMYSRSGNRLA